MTLQLFELFYPGETTKRPHHDFHRRVIFLQDLFQRGFSFILDKAIKLGVWHLRESKRTWHNDDISLAHLPPSSCKVHIRHGPRHSQVYASFRRHMYVYACVRVICHSSTCIILYFPAMLSVSLCFTSFHFYLLPTSHSRKNSERLPNFRCNVCYVPTIFLRAKCCSGRCSQCKCSLTARCWAYKLIYVATTY